MLPLMQVSVGYLTIYITTLRRSITHWKGQGEKPHIFFEYKSPSAADSARAVGHDRSDLQVIKISNNEVLKRKFRELAHGPLRERDHRCRPTGSSPRSTYAHFNRDSGRSTATGTDYGPPTKNSERSPYVNDSTAWAKYEAPHRDRDGAKNLYPRPSTSTSVTSSSSNSRERYSRRDRAFDKDYEPAQPPTKSQSVPLTPPMETSAGHKTRPTSNEKSLTVLQIPHAGEIIKFDLDTQLEDNPIGIIRILSAVKADQKVCASHGHLSCVSKLEIDSCG